MDFHKHSLAEHNLIDRDSIDMVVRITIILIHRPKLIELIALVHTIIAITHNPMPIHKDFHLLDPSQHVSDTQPYFLNLMDQSPFRSKS